MKPPYSFRSGNGGWRNYGEHKINSKKRNSIQNACIHEENSNKINENTASTNVNYSTQNYDCPTLRVEGAMPSPKPIMVYEIESLIEFTKVIGENCDKNFTVKMSGKRTKLFVDSPYIKIKIIEFLKQNNCQFYILSETVATINVAITRFLMSTHHEAIANTLRSECVITR